jgi:hypothetical protein
VQPETTIVNLRTTPYDVAIDRSGPFGNPYHAGIGTKTDAISAYRAYFHARVERDPEFRARVLALRGKRLGCHCAPRPCHGLVIVEWLREHQA